MGELEDQFSQVSITGGPHGRNTETLIDGVRLKGVTRVELIVDAMDAIRLKTFQIVRAMVDLQAEHTHAVTVHVVEQREEDREGKIVIVGEKEVATATADTLWEALYDCARQLELAASQGVAQSGTITSSSGRPPGH